MKIRRRTKAIAAIAVVTSVGLVIGLSACSGDTASPPPNAQEQAQNTVKERKNYTPTHDVEGKNYNARQELADNPATLIWCSVYPQNPGVKPFTVPIVGKLTSGNKRPYPTEVVKQYYNNGGEYNPELPGNDGFFGSSGEYRYGFGPDGSYHDFYGMDTYCTTVPTVIQKQTTQIAIASGGDLNLLDQQAEAALKACREKDPNPSKPCPDAARLLGVN